MISKPVLITIVIVANVTALGVLYYMVFDLKHDEKAAATISLRDSYRTPSALDIAREQRETEYKQRELESRIDSLESCLGESRPSFGCP
jgi:hypothetical protein